MIRSRLSTAWRRTLVPVLALAAAPALPARGQAVQARAAEILRASGTVEVQTGPQAPWTPARSGQQLRRGDRVRTSTVSVASLTFANAAQWQLVASSQLDLEEALAGGDAAIVVRLERGGAVSRWTPDRRSSGAKMTVKTAAGQASITGTEWSMRVEEDGRTALVVLEGSVELSNDRGRVLVHGNEAGEMRPGQAPTLLRLLTPEDRVQWVTSYAASPASYAAAGTTTGHAAEAIDRLDRAIGAGTAGAATYLAAADLLLEAGEFARAAAQAGAGGAKYPADAHFDALLSRIALFDNRPAESRVDADRAIAKSPRGADGWLALGEWGTRQGDAPVAWRAFNTATTLAPDAAPGWFGAGTVATEREDFPVARRLLQRALAIDPMGPGYRGQVGTLETLANHLTRAAIEYGSALELHPDDYVALTGRALLALKQARETDALDLLQRATLLEPRYARAQIYLGVAYYRLRRVDDAVKALGRATTLDPRDPLPYLMLTQIYTDTYQPWQAVDAARAAQTRMPFLKSLNQLSNTPKGGANLGNALAFFGSPVWAEHLAQESYSPSWAGSHLFLGDRYNGPYVKTSEYFQGLLADPTVFGGSPRFQTLLARPATYLTVPFTVAHDRFDGLQVQDTTVQPEVSLNGYANAWRPVAYALNLQTAPASSGSSTRATTSSWAGSIGIAPTPAWSLFTLLSSYKSDYTTTGLRLDATSTRVDGGVQYRHSPTSRLSIKGGTGTVDFSARNSIDPLLTTGSMSRELKLQHAFAIGDRHQIAWGVELARLPSNLTSLPISEDVITTLAGSAGTSVPSGFRAGWFLDGLIDDRSEVAYASERWIVGPHLELDAELVVTAVSETLSGTFHHPPLGIHIPAALPGDSSVRPQPRAGAVIPFAPGRVLRLAYQATTSALGAQDTLGPVATAGIPIDEVHDNQLGDIFRYRGQLEWQWSARTFTRGFAEHKRFGEVTSIRDPFISKITDYFAREPLARLRNQLRDVSQLNVASPALLEDTIATLPGSDAWLAGLTLNHMLSRQLALASELYWTRTATNPAADVSTRMPYYPDHAFSAGATWISPRHIYVSGSMMYRSDRLGINDSARVALRTIDAGTVTTLASKFSLLGADWTGQIAASWETPDKQWSVETLITDLVASAPLHDAGRQPAFSVTVKYRR